VGEERRIVRCVRNSSIEKCVSANYTSGAAKISADAEGGAPYGKVTALE
jgi:hypothetical protein